jgi:uncharacterized membrane protein
MKKLLIFLLCIFASSAACNLCAAEYIAHFDSLIHVNKDGSMNVTETIEYVNTDRRGLHGIVREFPTRYKGPYATEYTIGFNITGIQQNGKPVPYHIKKEYEGARIYIGSKDIITPPGNYTYIISYTTTRQLGFHDNMDVLYWNVTGNGWQLPITKVTALVTLPQNIPNKKISCNAYTGEYGDDGGDAICKVKRNNTVECETTKTLQVIKNYRNQSTSSMGLTIKVSWPQGFITRPTMVQELLRYAYDNSGFLIFALAVLMMIIYYFMVYQKIRHTEQEEPIIPLFYPPKNISPGGAHYILKQWYQVNQFTAELVDMAVNGLITIDAEKGWLKDTYVLKKTETIEEQTHTLLQKKILDELFGAESTITLTQSNSAQLERTINTLKGIYSTTYNEKYLVNNYSKSIFPAVVVFIIGGIVLAREPYLIESVLIWTAIVPAIAALCMFFYLLHTYTKTGRKLRNEILGFKMFLEATETERLKIIGTPPTRTPELYEKYLPYAIALGVEKAWSQQFASIFSSLEKKGISYHPIWYHGTSFGSFNPTNFSSTISNSLQSAVKSSGGGSSGGGGGRGFSGGGRGGGGGSSW